MKIGSIDFGDRPVFLAPMEDVTDIGFRLLCKRFGAAMVYTEFVSAEALIRDVKSTISKLTISDTERPVGIQIYGRDIEAMVEAAKIVEQAGPDVIDLNFGCHAEGGGCRETACHREDPLGLEPRTADHYLAGRTVAGLWHQGPHHSWAHPKSDVHRQCRLDADWRSEAQPSHTYSYYR